MTVTGPAATVTTVPFLFDGSKIKTGGRTFMITGDISRTNHEAVEVLADGSFGKMFKIRRGSAVVDLGRDHDLLTKFREGQRERQGDLKMGSVVRIAEGRFKDKVGILAVENQASYTVALPNETSVRVSKGILQQVSNESLIEALAK